MANTLSALINNNFSDDDKDINDQDGIDGYLTTPDGSLKKYDVSTKTEKVLDTNLASDPKDPERKNSNDPLTRKEERAVRREQRQLSREFKNSSKTGQKFD